MVKHDTWDLRYRWRFTGRSSGVYSSSSRATANKIDTVIVLSRLRVSIYNATSKTTSRWMGELINAEKKCAAGAFNRLAVSPGKWRHVRKWICENSELTKILYANICNLPSENLWIDVHRYFTPFSSPSCSRWTKILDLRLSWYQKWIQLAVSRWRHLHKWKVQKFLSKYSRSRIQRCLKLPFNPSYLRSRTKCRPPLQKLA